MQNQSDVVKKAKQYVKRYKIWCTVCALCLVLGYSTVVVLLDSGIATVWGALAAVWLMILIGSPILVNKCILSILSKNLDADTYLAAVYHGKFDTSAALWQLNGEYFCGHYQNVVSICKMKLNDPKIAKRFQYYYFVNLANVYFEIGDDENLRKVYEQYEAAFSKEKPSKQAKLRKRIPRMAFYGFYLKQDIEACLTWVNTPTPVVLNQYHRTLCKAKLALVRGNTEDANRYYEVLAKEVPQLNYGKLAATRLAAQGNQEYEDCSKLFELSDEPSEVTLYPANRRKIRRILGVCFIAILVGSLTVGLLKVFDSKKRYDREMEAYRESIRELVEQDYDDVEVLDTFVLKNGEDVIDTMFVCKTDKEIIVGCTYVYVDDPEQYYEKMTDISIASLSENRSPLWHRSFSSKTSFNQIESDFYTIESDLPANYLHLSTFEVNGQTVYYVVTEVISDVVVQ